MEGTLQIVLSYLFSTSNGIVIKGDNSKSRVFHECISGIKQFTAIEESTFIDFTHHGRQVRDIRHLVAGNMQIRIACQLHSSAF